MLKKWTFLALAAALPWGASGASAKVKVDSRIPLYQKVSGIFGSASSIGSDTMNNLMALWLEAFRKYYPNVKIQSVTGRCKFFKNAEGRWHCQH